MIDKDDCHKFKTSNNRGSVKYVRSHGIQATRGTSLSQRDSKLSHEIEASGQSVQDGAQTLKSHSIQKEAT